MIYLDHAATSMSKPPQVTEAVAWAMKNCASLGRSGHKPAVLAGDIAYDCRVAAACLFDTEPEQVVFTSNATHGLNMAISSLVGNGDKVVVSGFEHNAVMRPLQHLNADITVAGTKLFDPVDTVKAFEMAIDRETKAVICTHISNVFGYILPVEQIAQLCRERNVPFILDAAQSAGVLPVSLRNLGASFIAMPGHKGLLGPQGTGLLLCAQILKPLLYGGTGSNSLDMEMPDFLPDAGEAGTHNIPGIAGLRVSLRYITELGTESICAKEQALMFHLKTRLSDLPDVRCFWGEDQTQAGVLSVQLKDVDCERAALLLAEKGIAVRAGLHCAPMAHRSAGTLEEGTVRISVSHSNTLREIDFFADTLETLLSRK